MRSKILSVVGAFALLSMAPQASAALITLTEDACTGTCGTGPFGTIELIQTTPTLVTVTLTLKAGEYFVGTGAGEALEFNVPGIAITIGNITAGFGVGPAPASASAFGTFLQSVSCTVCQGGKSTNPSGPLSFTVTGGSGVTIASFAANAKGYLFAADIMGTNGNTGNVGALGSFTGEGSTVPEPATVSLVGAGILMVLFRRARTRKPDAA
jgi:hypothetical protein